MSFDELGDIIWDVDDPTFDEVVGAGSPTISWDLENSFLAEGQIQQLAVRVEPPSLVDMYVQVENADVTATEGVDYLTQNADLFIPAQSAMAFYETRALDDAEPELAESYTLRLGDPFDAPPSDETRSLAGSVGSPAVHTVTIGESDQDVGIPAVSFATSGASVNEDAGALAIPVSLSVPATEEIQVRVNYVAAASSATQGEDVAWTNEILTFGVNEQNKNVVLTVLDDLLVEDVETFRLRLELISGPVTFGPNPTYTLNITSNDSPPPPEDPTVGFRESETTANVGDPAALVRVLIEEGANPAGVTVNIGLTAVADLSQYSLVWPGGVPNEVTIPAGQLSADIEVTALDALDGLNDPPLLNFSINVGDGYERGTILAHTTTLTEDPPGIPEVFWGTSSQTVTEDTAGTVSIPVRLSEAATNDVVVAVAENPDIGNATEGLDYNILTPEVTIPQGELEAFAQVQILDDALEEGQEGEFFTISLVSGNVMLGSPQSTGITIEDDETAPQLIPFWDATSYVALEGGSTTQVILRAPAGSNPDGVSVNIGLSGTASASDYNATWPGGVANVVTMEPGQEQAVITIEAIEDSQADPGEFLRFEILNGSGYSPPTNTETTLTINEGPLNGTLVQWELDGVYPEGDDILVQWVTGIDPVAADSLPFFYVGGVLCDVFPVSYTRDGLVDSVQVVGRTPNTGSAVFTTQADNPVEPDQEWSTADLSNMQVRCQQGPGELWTADFPPGIQENYRNGNLVREDVLFDRLQGNTQAKRGPGVTMFTTRRPGAIELTLFIQNQCYELNTATLHAADPRVTSTFYFESMELIGLPAGYQIVEADIEDPSMDTARETFGFTPHLVMPEGDGAITGANAQHVLPAGSMFVRRYVIFNASSAEPVNFSKEAANQIGRLAGYGCAVDGEYAVNRRRFYGPSKSRVGDQLTSLRRYKDSLGDIHEGRAASIQYEFDRTEEFLQDANNGTDLGSPNNFSQPNQGYYQPCYLIGFNPGSGIYIDVVTDANWCRSGWRGSAAWMERMMQRSPMGIIDPSQNGREITAEQFVAANGGTFFPYDLSPRASGAGAHEFWFPHWQRSTYNGSQFDQVNRISDETRFWNTPRVVGSSSVRQIQDFKVFPFEVGDPNGSQGSAHYGIPESDHHSRYDGRLEGLVFGANIGWAKYLLRQGAHHMRRSVTYQRHNTPGAFTSIFNRERYDLEFFIDRVNNNGDAEQGSYFWDRGFGMMARAVALAYHTYPATSPERGFSDLWIDSWSRAAEVALTPWGNGSRFQWSPGDTNNYPSKVTSWGPFDPVLQTGAMPTPGVDGAENWTAAQTWMSSFLGIGNLYLAMGCLDPGSAAWQRLERNTREFSRVIWRTEPDGPIRFGDDRPPSYMISSTGTGGTSDPVLSIPHAWRFQGITPGSFPDFQDKRGLIQLVGSYRIAKMLGDAVDAAELRDNIRRFLSLPVDASTSDMLAACFGSENGSFGINSVRGIERSERHPYLHLVGELFHELATEQGQA